ncbi:MAG: NUDIX domain-containing protein [Verrucomicrobiales bacterium]|jgi:phosphoglycolate phosphatase-like HAD superfamily hydrolase/ADP-ribose pyrophosphatase YjhB (NUDIX family)|nr:NUDIX domain-containing protein [Verrucomicrobiales bacterium]
MAVIKNIIFDWSGTLVNDFPPVLDATNQIFQHYGRPAMGEQEFREKFCLPFTEFYAKHLPEASMVELDSHYHSSFKLLQEGIPLLPYAKEILEYCRSQGMKIFLLSSIHAEHFAVQAERLGIKEYFTKAFVQIIDKRKVIHSLLAEFNLDPRETLFVGDMEHDVATAKHGGIVSCGVLTGYNTLSMLQEVEPDLLFKDLLGLKNYLEHHREPETSTPVATVGALIVNPEGKLLMIRTYKWSNLWGIPGGKIKGGETSLDAIRREVLEETGLAIGDIKFVMVQDCIHSKEFYKPAHFLLLNYLAKTDGNHEVILNDEADEYRWLSPEEALELPLNTPSRILLDSCRANGDI